ncbi:MAG: MarR family transcriptional regulator [Pseudomonadota bacterium]|nr:MarR family transcriptional regulator [Pseudomonadota bacterium]
MTASLTASCPEQTFGHLVRDVSTLWREIVDRRLEPLGLSAARWQPLVLLYRANEPMTQTVLAAALGIEAPSLVRLLDRLSRDGWVERKHCPDDRRAYHIVLTAKAHGACAEIEDVLATTRHEILSVLKKPEMSACVYALQRVRDQALQLRHDGQPPAESPLNAVLRRPRPGKR